MLQIPLHNTLLTLTNAGKSIALVKLCLLGHEIMKQPLWDEFGFGWWERPSLKEKKRY